MLTRRKALAAGFATLLSPQLANAHSTKKFKLNAKFEPQLVPFAKYPVGTLIIDPRKRFIYWVEKPGFARRYGVGVGRAGLAFRGSATVGRKAKWPRWTPTKNMIKRQPKKYARFAKGVPGGPSNPLGARALYLFKNGRDTLYRIHGTTQPSSIGRAVSNGCIRMLNRHVKDLYTRVPAGTKVIVL